MLIMVRPFLILSTRSCKSYAEKVVEALKSNPEHLLFPQGFDYTGELSVLSLPTVNWRLPCTAPFGANSIPVHVRRGNRKSSG